MAGATERREALKALYREARECVRCPLHQTRTQVVFGNGNADADLMFVGEAPGANEDRMGLPFVGQAGKLLDKLLGEIGMQREDVFVANVLKCLRYTSLVQLGDGSWERIGRLVRSRYDGSVMSVDEMGRLIPRRVVGWHVAPLGHRRVFRLTCRSRKNTGPSRLNTQLTGDHPVLTERGYVPVEQLRPDDRIATGQGLSELAYDVVGGTLLGDRCLPKAPSHLTFGHSSHRLEYAQYVPPSMRYKLHPEDASGVPFDPDYLDPGEKVVTYDEVELEEMTGRDAPGAAYFCIDVEDTNNFVTAGGVVHNCRPPDNRDPHPNEIEACRSYLDKQIELIEPTVICTLGNFSTKLLRADNTGISRLHGHEEIRVIGSRAVRLYPLYHPAAALYTASTLDALRADFHRIPELLTAGAPPQPEPVEEVPEPEEPGGHEGASRPDHADGQEPAAAQLGLF